MWTTEAEELSKASYGIELVHLIGKVRVAQQNIVQILRCVPHTKPDLAIKGVQSFGCSVPRFIRFRNRNAVDC
jgi:hypothetical protein